MNERKIILSVEDNEDIASLIRLVIRHAPVELVHANNAEEAQKILESQPPDLILLDMMLPGMTGIDFLEKIRHDKRYEKTPVIIISVRAEASYRKRAQELGVVRYLLKPFSPTVLRQEIQQTINVTWKETSSLGGLPPLKIKKTDD